MRKKITDEQSRAAVRLKEAFKREKAASKTNYAEAAESLDMTAAAVSQYMNQTVPINMGFLLRFCALYPSIDPMEVYPELFEGVEFPPPKDPSGILDKFYSLDEPLQDAILLMIENQKNKSD